MRILLLFRGAPGVGKSTFIKEHGLEPYCISTDNIRMLCQSPVLDVNGKQCIGMDHEKFVWDTLFKILEFRMDRGEFTVVDATNTKSTELNQYKKLCGEYRYRIYCIDMTDIPIEECKRRNLLRPLLKQVPEASIDKAYARFANQKIPSGITAIKPEELNSIFVKKFDFNQYKKIHHIGDIHGCYTALKEYLDSVGGFKEDEFYIFCGDYIDRGKENVEVLNFLLENYNRKNVLLLEANHEKWLYCYSNGLKSRGREFELYTKKQLDEAGISKKDVRMFYRKLAQIAYYEYDGKTILVNHGGVSNIPENVTFIPTVQFIKGVGSYNDFEDVAKNFDKNTDENTYQIFGHRNTKSAPIQLSERCFNLEGKVEFGGHLRVVTLDHEEGFKTIEIKNNVFISPEEREEKDTLLNSSIADVIVSLRNSKYVNEKEFGNISSFNFTTQAFMKGVWDNTTIKARGLYINTKEGYILARGYEKFFKINEMDETKIERLEMKMSFPVSMYKKENGYLGLVSYNPETDDFFISSKSNPEAEFAEWMREAFYKAFEGREDKLSEFKRFLMQNNVTAVFENVDMDRDPHIIDYPENHLFLLDMIYNKMEFEKIPYSHLRTHAEHFGLECKTRERIVNTWQEFFDIYKQNSEETESTCRKDIEGWVIEDSKGFMVKMKNQYYNFWKFMRGLSHEVIRKGYTDKTSALLTPLSNGYYGWLKDYVANTPKEEREEKIPKNIVLLRRMFLQEHPEFK